MGEEMKIQQVKEYTGTVELTEKGTDASHPVFEHDVKLEKLFEPQMQESTLSEALEQFKGKRVRITIEEIGPIIYDEVFDILTDERVRNVLVKNVPSKTYIKDDLDDSFIPGDVERVLIRFANSDHGDMTEIEYADIVAIFNKTDETTEG